MNSQKPYVYRLAEDLGIPMIDSETPLAVVVTASDVINAKKANSKHCALARASLRLPGVHAAYFFRSKAFLEYPDRMVRFQLPPSVQKELVSFDRAQIVVPGKYQLSAISTADRREYNAARRATERFAKKKQSKKKLGQRGFDNTVSDMVKAHLGGKTVSGIRAAHAPEPLRQNSTKYHHRSQYVRTLKEPA